MVMPNEDSLKKSKEFVDGLTLYSRMQNATQQQVLSFLTTRSQTILAERQAYYKELISIRDNFIVNGIYDILQHDVFLYNIDGNCWSLDHEDKVIKKELSDLLQNLNITETLYSIFGDLLHYGSYALRPIYEPGKGLVKLIDDLYPYNVVALTDGSIEPIAFYIDNTIMSETDAFDMLYRRDSSYYLGTNYQVVYFRLDYNYRKLIYNPPKNFSTRENLYYLNRLHNEDEKVAGKNIEFAYKLLTPKSYVDGVIDKIKEALLVDKASVVRKVSTIINNSIIGVPMPNLYDIEQITDTIQQYESLLNSSSVLDVLNSDNATEALANATRLKAIPIMGETGRGDLREIDLGRREDEIDPEQGQSIIASTLDSLGIPQDLFFGNLDSKTNLKQNIRYAKKVKFIQSTLIKELKNICKLHWKAKYNKDLDLNKLSITLKNNVNYDELENVDSQDLLIASTSSMLDLFERLETLENSDYFVNSNKIFLAIKENLHSINSKYVDAIQFGKKEEGEGLEGTDEMEEKPQTFKPPSEEEQNQEIEQTMDLENENENENENEEGNEGENE